jgi:calpain-15
MIKEIKPVFDSEDGTFWMSFADFCKFFRSINVCRVRNWQETRIRGKFLRIEEYLDSNTEQVVSKWYYELEIKLR